MNENWMPVVGYEGLYSVSDQGRVRSENRRIVFPDGRGGEVWRGRIVKGRILKAVPHKPTASKPKTYYRVSLGRGNMRYIHVLVAQAFLTPVPGLWVLHRDDDSLNNAVTNLYYGTPKDNAGDTVSNGHHPEVNKTHCKHGHEFTPENTALRTSPETGNQMRQCIECGRRRAREQYLAQKTSASADAQEQPVDRKSA